MPFFHFDPVQLLNLLHDLEWIGTDRTGFKCCPLCDAADPVQFPSARADDETPHARDCRLAAMLAQLTEDLAQFKEP